MVKRKLDTQLIVIIAIVLEAIRVPPEIAFINYNPTVVTLYSL